MQPHPTPEIPWHTVATDLFEIRNSKYLLIVEYYSRFPILRKLASTTVRVLIQEMKAVFAELGVPSVIVSDGGPQYTSVEFKDFMKQWQIEHRVSSPRYPQSNGMAESYVQTMKASLIKTMEEGCEVWQPDEWVCQLQGRFSYYCFGCIVDFVVLLFYLVYVDRSGSLSGGAFNQLKLMTLNIVLTILYSLKSVSQRSLLQCLNSSISSTKSSNIYSRRPHCNIK